jgi:hypothetical protein
MTEDIKEKIKAVLRKEHYSELDVVYFFVETYKLLERENNLDNFKTIKFYRNWVCHSSLDKDGEKIFDEAYILIRARKYFPDDSKFIDIMTDKIPECFRERSFSKLKGEIELFLDSFLNKEKFYWDELRKNLYSVITDTPLLIKENGKEILRFVCQRVILQGKFDELQIETRANNLIFNFIMDDYTLG